MIHLFVVISLSVLGPWAMAQLNIQEVLEKGLEQSAPYKIQKSVLKTKKTELTQSYFEFLPTLNLQLSDMQFNSPLGATDPDKNHQQNYALVGQWNLFRGFSDKYQISEKQDSVSAEEIKLKIIQSQEEKSILSIYFNFIKNKKLQQSYEQLLKSKKNVYEVAQEKARRGQLSVQEVDKFYVDLFNSDAAASDQKNNLTQAAFELEKTISTTQIHINWPWQELLSKADRKISILASDENIHSIYQNKVFAVAQSNETKYQGRQWPSLDFRASYGETNLNESRWTKDWNLGLTLTVNLFNNYSDRKNYLLAFENKIQTEISKNQTLKNIQSEVLTLRDNLLESIASAQKRQRNSELAQKLFADNTRRFQLGRASVNELLQDQERLFQAELLAIQGWAQAHELLADFCRAQGLTFASCHSVVFK